MVGAAVPADPVRWQAVRRVVSHRLVNGYKSDDLTLLLLFRANSLKVGKVAGLEVSRPVLAHSFRIRVRIRSSSTVCYLFPYIYSVI
eukprot:COSAG05_NODE_407_length_10145_cov_234.042604_4_plen_87_part_00